MGSRVPCCHAEEYSFEPHYIGLFFFSCSNFLLSFLLYLTLSFLSLLILFCNVVVLILPFAFVLKSASFALTQASARQGRRKHKYTHTNTHIYMKNALAESFFSFFFV